MIYPIPDILADDERERIVQALSRLNFVDGKATAGTAIGEFKHNLEMMAPQARLMLSEAITSALTRSESFMALAMPRQISPLLFNCYQPEMFYGDHVDEPLMGTPPNRLRADLSMTVFLSPPDSYDGGELLINTDGPTLAVKLPAGHMVLYPSDTLHRVAPVTRGARLAAVGWIQSEIRRADQRGVLWELTRAQQLLVEAGQTGDAGSPFNRIGKARVNLTRMWAEL
jgi:PKHD-type hydroxylase